jgi:glutathione peroxidase
MYAALQKATGVPPKWNFHKYLIDRKGKVVANYVSDVTPGDAKLIADVRRLLAEK